MRFTGRRRQIEIENAASRGLDVDNTTDVVRLPGLAHGVYHIADDVASRGLDIPKVSHVINWHACLEDQHGGAVEEARFDRGGERLERNEGQSFPAEERRGRWKARARKATMYGDDGRRFARPGHPEGEAHMFAGQRRKTTEKRTNLPASPSAAADTTLVSAAKAGYS